MGNNGLTRRGFLAALLGIAGIMSLTAASGVHGRVPLSVTALPSTAAGYRSIVDNLDDALWAGADGSFSVPLPDGRVLWGYGDTERLVSGAYTLPDHNSFVALSAAGVPAVVSRPIPDAAGGDFYWPASAVVEGTTRLRVFCLRIHPRSGGYDILPTEIASFSLPSLTFLGMSPVPADTLGRMWGASVYSDSSFTYVAGSKLNWIAFDGYLARVPRGTLTALSGWRFWNGTAWVASNTGAVVTTPSGVMDSGWDTVKVGSSYRLVTKDGGGIGSTVVEYSSSSLMGGWGTAATLFTPSTPPATSYAAHVHPEVALSSGKMLLTVSRNDTFANILTNPALYRPDYVEVSL